MGARHHRGTSRIGLGAQITHRLLGGKGFVLPAGAHRFNVMSVAGGIHHFLMASIGGAVVLRQVFFFHHTTSSNINDDENRPLSGT